MADAELTKYDKELINLYESLVEKSWQVPVESLLSPEQDIISKVIELAYVVGTSMGDMEGVFSYLGFHLKFETDVLNRYMIATFDTFKDTIYFWPKLKTIMDDSELCISIFYTELEKAKSYEDFLLGCSKIGLDIYDTIEILTVGMFQEYNFIIYTGTYSREIYAGMFIYLLLNIKIISNIKYFKNANL